MMEKSKRFFNITNSFDFTTLMTLRKKSVFNGIDKEA